MAGLDAMAEGEAVRSEVLSAGLEPQPAIGGSHSDHSRDTRYGQ
jgi:hypothetical protein